jgi:creatinine deaminase
MSTEYVPLLTVLEHTEVVTDTRTPLDSALAATMLATAYDEALLGLSEGGIPIGAALFSRDGTLLGSGHNRRVQEDDASVHAETDAFRKAGRRRDYPECVMVTTLSPCWYCAGLVRQFNIGAVVIGEAENFHGGHDWLKELERRHRPLERYRAGGPKSLSPASPRPGVM